MASVPNLSALDEHHRRDRGYHNLLESVLHGRYRGSTFLCVPTSTVASRSTREVRLFVQLHDPMPVGRNR